MSLLKKHNVWKLVKDHQAIDTKWVYKVKKYADGTTNKIKACLIARGFTQSYGTDYFKTFAPVIRHTSLRFLFALTVKKK